MSRTIAPYACSCATHTPATPVAARPVANPYFPLKPGTVFVYRGSEGRLNLIEHLRVTHHTKRIEGVKTVVISDILFANGRLNEATHDYYADDNHGTTWYFGEKTATYD